ncbi:MAG: hypothetical protein EP332_02945 [Bacteroidetes bacterium]|nr:MAG: hypothetical protein EP332_02945 [Bacteroidota bacterium]
MKWILGLCLLLVFSCGKDDKSFTSVECVTLSNPLDTVELGSHKFWLEIKRGQTDDQVNVFLRSDSTVNISLMEADFIQMSNRFGCYQTGNTKKYFGIGEEYYIFSDIPPSYMLEGTSVKVRLRRSNEEKVDFIGNGI